MYNATDATRQLDLWAHLPIGADATVVEFGKTWLPTATSPTISAAPAYTLTARVLHWFTAVVIALMIPLGVITANDWGGRLQTSLSGLHQLFGAMLIPIVFIRLGHRLMNPPPPLPQEIAPLQRFAAHVTHAGLYVLLIVQPLVGWIAVSASGAQAAVLGLFTLPSVAPEDPILAEKLFVLHDLFGISIAGLVAAHIGAALYHHVVRRDRIMMRMITG
jgi:cytochrome b561